MPIRDLWKRAIGQINLRLPSSPATPHDVFIDTPQRHVRLAADVESLTMHTQCDTTALQRMRGAGDARDDGVVDVGEVELVALAAVVLNHDLRIVHFRLRRRQEADLILCYAASNTHPLYLRHTGTSTAFEAKYYA